MKCLDVPYYKQDTGYTCGPTSLQMVLAYFGIHESEADLAKELQTDQHTGTHHEKMINGVIDRGLHCYVNDNANWHEVVYLLGYEIPVIVRFIEPSQEEDHYGVVVGANHERTVVHDPWNGESIEYSTQDFLSRWTCDTLGTCKQWLMAVSPEALPIGHQYHPHEQ